MPTEILKLIVREYKMMTNTQIIFCLIIFISACAFITHDNAQVLHQRVRNQIQNEHQKQIKQNPFKPLKGTVEI